MIIYYINIIQITMTDESKVPDNISNIIKYYLSDTLLENVLIDKMSNEQYAIWSFLTGKTINLLKKSNISKKIIVKSVSFILYKIYKGILDDPNMIYKDINHLEKYIFNEKYTKEEYVINYLLHGNFMTDICLNDTRTNHILHEKQKKYKYIYNNKYNIDKFKIVSLCFDILYEFDGLDYICKINFIRFLKKYRIITPNIQIYMKDNNILFKRYYTTKYLC